MRENLIIMLLTVIHGILKKIMLKFFSLFNFIIHNNNFYAGAPRPPVPLLYSYHQQVTLANNKRLTEVQNTTFYLTISEQEEQEKQAVLLKALRIQNSSLGKLWHQGIFMKSLIVTLCRYKSSDPNQCSLERKIFIVT